MKVNFKKFSSSSVHLFSIKYFFPFPLSVMFVLHAKLHTDLVLSFYYLVWYSQQDTEIVMSPITQYPLRIAVCYDAHFCSLGNLTLEHGSLGFKTLVSKFTLIWFWHSWKLPTAPGTHRSENPGLSFVNATPNNELSLVF